MIKWLGFGKAKEEKVYFLYLGDVREGIVRSILGLQYIQFQNGLYLMNHEENTAQRVNDMMKPYDAMHMSAHNFKYWRNNDE